MKNPAELLCDYVMRGYGRRLTAKQLRGPWTYIGTKNGEISGVVIDADGDSAGHRVMLVDLGLPEFPPPESAPPQLELTP